MNSEAIPRNQPPAVIVLENQCGFCFFSACPYHLTLFGFEQLVTATNWNRHWLWFLYCLHRWWSLFGTAGVLHPNLIQLYYYVCGALEGRVARSAWGIC